jgi:large subunit ribosomal protein L21
MTLPQAIRKDDEVRGRDPAAPMGAVENRRSDMYAVIKTGGKQYRVKPDDILEIERLAGEPGDILQFDQVLMVVNEAGIEIGTPVISGAMVAAELVEQTRGDKNKLFKTKRRKHYRRTMGHRQDLTQIRITEILTGGAKPTRQAAAKKQAPAKAGQTARTEKPVKAATPEPATPKAAPAVEPKAPAKKAPAKKAPAQKAEARKAADKADDLTQISGIGPVIAEKLVGLGITKLKQIAGLSAKKAAEIDEQLNFKGRIEREEWIEQAKELIAGKPPRAKSDRQD